MIAISSALTVIPVPAPMLKVREAVMSPPPDLKKLYFSDVNVLIQELNEKQFN